MLLVFCPYNKGFNMVGYGFLWSQFRHKKWIFQNQVGIKKNKNACIYGVSAKEELADALSRTGDLLITKHKGLNY